MTSTCGFSIDLGTSLCIGIKTEISSVLSSDFLDLSSLSDFFETVVLVFILGTLMTALVASGFVRIALKIIASFIESQETSTD